MILLFGGNFPARTSFKYLIIYLIFPYNPWSACTFNKILLDKEFKEIYLIYLKRC
jgi:hypothetical protein